jgi:hypothetical protein
MSGQCLSPNDAGHALTPATHRCLGEPLPHQQANRMQAPPLTESHLWSEDIIRYYLQFPAAIPDRGVGTYTLLSLSPLSIYRSKLLARLACLIHAANVHSEPESNPSIDWLISAEADVLPNRIPLPQSNGYRRLILYFKIVSFPPVTQQKQKLMQGALRQNRWCRSRSRAGRNRKRLTTKLSKIISGTAKAIPET